MFEKLNMTVEGEPKAALSRAGGKRCQGHPRRQVRDEQDKKEWMLRRGKVQGGNRVLVRG